MQCCDVLPISEAVWGTGEPLCCQKPHREAVPRTCQLLGHQVHLYSSEPQALPFIPLEPLPAFWD